MILGLTNTLLSRNRGLTVSPTYNAEVTAWIARLATEGFAIPSPENLAILNTFVEGRKSSGVWAKLDLLQIWAQDSASANAGRVNIISPLSTISTIYNAITFTNKVDVAGDGVSAYIDTGWNPADNGVNFTQNSASFGAFFSAAGSTDYALGLENINNTRYRPRTITSQRLNTSTNISFDATQGIGFSGIRRTSSSNVNNLQKDGTVGVDKASTSTSLLSGNGNFCLFRSQTNYSDASIGIAFAGGNLTNADWLDFRNGVVTYLNAVAAL